MLRRHHAATDVDREDNHALGSDLQRNSILTPQLRLDNLITPHGSYWAGDAGERVSTLPILGETEVRRMLTMASFLEILGELSLAPENRLGDELDPWWRNRIHGGQGCKSDTGAKSESSQIKPERVHDKRNFIHGQGLPGAALDQLQSFFRNAGLFRQNLGMQTSALSFVGKDLDEIGRSFYWHGTPQALAALDVDHGLQSCLKVLKTGAKEI